MKYLKIFGCVAALAALTACSSNDDKPSYNTAANVTVSMGQAEIAFRESAGMVKVPVTVHGESNGYVTVVCEVREYGSNPAMEDVHYLLTSKTLTLEAGATEGYFEFKTVDDYEINPSRYFTVRLELAYGATISSPDVTIVELMDNDEFPYDRLAGTWYIPCESWGGSPQNLVVELKPYEDGTLGYGHAYQMLGFGGENTNIDVSFTYSEAQDKGSISIKLGQNIGKYEDFDLVLYGVDDAGYIQTAGTYIFEWSEDFSTLNLTSQESANIVALYNNEGWYIYEAAMFVTHLSRQPE